MTILRSAILALVGFGFATSLLSAQLCRGNGFPSGSLLGVSTGVATTDGDGTIPTISLDLGMGTDLLRFIPVSQTMFGEIRRGAMSNSGLALGYAFGFPTPEIGAGSLGLCLSPYASLNWYEPAELSSYSYFGGGISVDAGYAMDLGGNTLIPFASLGFAQFRRDRDVHGTTFFLDAGTTYLINDFVQVGARMRFADPEYHGLARLVLSAGLGL